MRKLVFILPILLLTSCGDESITTQPDDSVEISVTVNPERVILDPGESHNFSVFVYGTSNINVTWLVQDIPGGNTEFGTINQDGDYHSPVSEPNADSIKISAVSEADSSVRGNAWVIIIDPSKIYVSESGSDSTGIGSRNNPYRTITHALGLAVSMQTVIVESGVYNASSNELFPLYVPAGVILMGKGADSTFVVGPGGGHNESGSVFSLDGDAITIEALNISTADNNGVGIWLLPGIFVKIRDNHIGPNYIGIAARGNNLPRPMIESNVISGDSIGISAGEMSEPMIRNNQIIDCGNIGVQILDSARPDLGTVDSTDAGGNTIRDCGLGNQWLIRNESPDTIWAVGNTWALPNPLDNDQFIYDDDEDINSGPVLLINQ
ncbi:MAG: DUF1565 domain-containing protein [candidate division Zixibacteria bacterium]